MVHKVLPMQTRMDEEPVTLSKLTCGLLGYHIGCAVLGSRWCREACHCRGFASPLLYRTASSGLAGDSDMTRKVYWLP